MGLGHHAVADGRLRQQLLPVEKRSIHGCRDPDTGRRLDVIHVRQAAIAAGRRHQGREGRVLLGIEEPHGR
eukprot:9139773-Prorocentrum_lima.AAC.1